MTSTRFYGKLSLNKLCATSFFRSVVLEMHKQHRKRMVRSDSGEEIIRKIAVIKSNIDECLAFSVVYTATLQTNP